MRTYPISDDGSFRLGFQMENVFLGTRQIKKILSGLDGISSIRCRRLFDSSMPNGIHIEFYFHGKKCAVIEPHGDSSRYWVIQLGDPDEKTDLSSIEIAFRNNRVSIIRIIVIILIMIVIAACMIISYYLRKI